MLEQWLITTGRVNSLKILRIPHPMKCARMDERFRVPKHAINRINSRKEKCLRSVSKPSGGTDLK